MRRFNLSSVFTLLIIMSVTFTSCEVIGSIFKAGVWVGVVVVVVIILVIFWLIRKARK